MAERVTVLVTEGACCVWSPYNEDFVPRAKLLAGHFRGGRWEFPESQTERVRALCLEIYGTDGSTPIPTVTVRLKLQDRDRWEAGTEVTLCGRRVAKVLGRDGVAILSDNVVVLKGGFDSGGSRKNPRICVQEGTVIELLEVPQPAAERVIAAGTSGWVLSAEVIPQEVAPAIDVEALKAERQKLAARLAEVNTLIGNP